MGWEKIVDASLAFIERAYGSAVFVREVAGGSSQKSGLDDTGE